MNDLKLYTTKQASIYTNLSQSCILKRAKNLNINPFKTKLKKCLFNKEELEKIQSYISKHDLQIFHTVHLHTVFHIYESKMNRI
jgi:hypothetical protein